MTQRNTNGPMRAVLGLWPGRGTGERTTRAPARAKVHVCMHTRVHTHTQARAGQSTRAHVHAHIHTRAGSNPEVWAAEAQPGPSRLPERTAAGGQGANQRQVPTYPQRGFHRLDCALNTLLFLYLIYFFKFPLKERAEVGSYQGS